MRTLIRLLVVVAGIIATLAVVVYFRFGGGNRLEDRTGAPLLPGSVLETVVDLDYPPGNIAVAGDGRVFFTLHPDGNPPAKVLELVDGQSVPYPSEAFQKANGESHFQSILSIRIDRQGRLWVLDYADYGRGQPRLLAFDLKTDQLVHSYDFPAEVAGLLSMLNDLQVSPDGKKIYIAETSPILQRPALIVYDVEQQRSRRVLDGHKSVLSEDLIIQAPGRDMIVYGLYTMRIAVDSIALDTRGEWLYYGAVTGSRLYRVRAADLDDESLGAAQLAAKVEDFAEKTLSDGITMDDEDNIYLSDMEHSAIVRLDQERRLMTLLKDDRLRWPDGFSWGPGGWLYVTCSSLENVLFVSSDTMRANAPYQIFRFKPGASGVPGH